MLGPYCEAKLPEFRKADEVVKKKTQPLIRQIEEGTASDFDNDAYRKADPRTRQSMQGAYLREKLGGDTELREAMEAGKRNGIVVDAILELAQLTMRRPRGEKEPAARKQELNRARDLLLRLRGIVRDRPDVDMLVDLFLERSAT